MVGGKITTGSVGMCSMLDLDGIVGAGGSVDKVVLILESLEADVKCSAVLRPDLFLLFFLS